MSQYNHYETLDISPKATRAEIKQAYRRLAKLFHPDSNNQTPDTDKIIEINAAYEVLGDPQRRRSYDRQLQEAHLIPGQQNFQQRTADAHRQYRSYRQTAQKADAELEVWLQQVYRPVNKFIAPILRSLNTQLDQLAADPFDDELMSEFQAYLENCRHSLEQAQQAFRSQPNPPNVASVAASLYHCLNQLGDGIEQLELFTLNYDDYYLHTGQELFRIASGLRSEAQNAIKNFN